MSTKSNCKIPWGKDEVILALAFYYSTTDKHFYPSSKEVQLFSKQLCELPLCFLQPKPEDFRNCNGMHYQLSKLHMVLKGAKELSYLAKTWGEVISYYRNQDNLLMKSASAILKTSKWLSNLGILVNPYDAIFAEGSILECLHSITERNIPCQDKNCAICGMFPSAIYRSECISLLETHLLLEPWSLTPNMKICKKDVITVCPNCHKVIHAIRPWISNPNGKQILTWENK